MERWDRDWREFQDVELEMYFENVLLKQGIDKDGFLSPTDFAQLLKHSGFYILPELVLSMIMQADKSCNGTIR